MEDEYRYFKFRSIDKRLIESITGGQLWFATPGTLNDPFDCQLNLRKSFMRAAASADEPRRTQLLAALSRLALLEKWERQFARVGVCSFSLCSEDSLLWSHYADRHKGVCLLYRFSEQFLLDGANRIIGASEVSYQPDVLTEWVKGGPLSPDDTDAFVDQLTRIYLTAKSPAWAYEKEARILRFDAGSFPVPKGSLTQVCFGLQTPKSDIDLVVKLSIDYAGVETFAKIVRGDNDFDIRMEPL